MTGKDSQKRKQMLQTVLMRSSVCSAVSFKSCVLSWFFLWHLVWLSIMQLRHYFFIGTLNPTLNRLARNDPDLGNLSLTSVSDLRSAFGHDFVFSIVSCALSEPVHQRLRHNAALWRAVRSLERAHHGQTQRKKATPW